MTCYMNHPVEGCIILAIHTTKSQEIGAVKFQYVGSNFSEIFYTAEWVIFMQSYHRRS